MSRRDRSPDPAEDDAAEVADVRVVLEGLSASPATGPIVASDGADCVAGAGTPCISAKVAVGLGGLSISPATGPIIVSDGADSVAGAATPRIVATPCIDPATDDAARVGLWASSNGTGIGVSLLLSNIASNNRDVKLLLASSPAEAMAVVPWPVDRRQRQRTSTRS